MSGWQAATLKMVGETSLWVNVSLELEALKRKRAARQRTSEDAAGGLYYLIKRLAGRKVFLSVFRNSFSSISLVFTQSCPWPIPGFPDQLICYTLGVVF